MQRQEKIKDWVIERVKIPRYIAIVWPSPCSQNINFVQLSVQSDYENSAMHMNGKTSRLRINFIDHGVKVCTQIVEQVSLSFLCCALFMCIPELKMGTTNRKWSMNQLPVLWLIFFHGYPQDGLVSLLHNHMHSCCHILKGKKNKNKTKNK